MQNLVLYELTCSNKDVRIETSRKSRAVRIPRRVLQKVKGDGQSAEEWVSGVFLSENNKMPIRECYPSEDWTWDLCHPGLMLSFLS